MQYRTIGNTDMKVSTVCQGCWSIVTEDFTWGGNELDDSIAAIHASLEAGVNFFDTAEGYGKGESEEILARALGPSRKDVIIATKVSGGHLAPDDLVAACENSLKRLATDYIDLYQIHWPRPDVPMEETLAALERLKSQGKIRAVGVSNFGAGYLREALSLGRVESNQVAYSLLWRPVEHEVVPACVENNVSILSYSSLCQGLLAGKFAGADEVPDTRARTRLFGPDRPHTRHFEPGCERQAFEAIDKIRKICRDIDQPMDAVALAWLLSRDGVTSVIVGSRNAEQARRNARAADVRLDEQTIEALSTATEPVKEYAGKNCDMWLSDSRMER